MRVLTLAAIALLAVGAAAPALAQQSFPSFEAMDANKDGKVTKAEFLAALSPEQKAIGERVFAARDTNKDGVITKDEVAAPPAK